MNMYIFKKVTKQYLKNDYHFKVDLKVEVMTQIEQARRYYIHTINTNTTVTVTSDAKGIS